MSYVICISSSDDDDDPSKKDLNSSNKGEKLKDKLNQPQKRKLSLNSTEENGVKKQKNQKWTNTSMKVSSNKTHSNDNSVKTVSENENVNNRSVSPKPGTSKYFDEIENKQQKNLKSHDGNERVLNSPNTSQQLNPVRKIIKPKLVVKEKIPILPDSSDDIFKKFLEACEKRKNDEVTKKILSKLSKHYEQLTSSDKNNEEFRRFLNDSLQKISNNYKQRFYPYIQEMQDEIKRLIKHSKIVGSSKTESTEHVNIEKETNSGDEIEVLEENRKTVKKLEHAIKICKKRIKKYEEQEVNFDDEENSTYLREDKYKRRLVQLCESLSKLVGDNVMRREIHNKQLKRKDITDEMTGITSVDDAIISFINIRIKKVNRLKHLKKSTAIADYLQLPDYEDILQCITKCNNEKNLGLSNQKIKAIALTAFKSIIRCLKKKRICESEEYFSSYLDFESDDDPALKYPELNEKLKINKKEGDEKLKEIFEKYVKKEEGLSKEDLERQTQTNSDSEDDSDSVITENKEENENKYESIHAENENHKESKEIIIKENTDQVQKEDNTIQKPAQDNTRQIKNVDKNKNHESSTDENERSNNTDLKNKITIHDKQENVKCQESSTNIDKIDNNNEIKNVNNEIKSKNECVSSDRKKVINTEDLNSLEKISDKKSSIDIRSNKSSETSEVNNISKNNITNSMDVDDVIQILSDDDEKINLDDTHKIFYMTSTKEVEAEEEKEEEEITLVYNDESSDTDDNNCVLKDSTRNNQDPLDITSCVSENTGDINFVSMTQENEITKSIENEAADKFKINNTIESLEISNNIDKNIADVKESKINEACNSKDVKKSVADIVHEVLKNYYADVNPCQTLASDNALPNNTKIVNKLPNIPAKNKVQVKKSTQSIKTMEIDDEIEIYVEEQDDTSKETKKTLKEDTSTFLKVRSFAKPPDSWKDSSPVKSKKDFNFPKREVALNLSKPECVDLTNEKDSQPRTSTQIINAAA